MVVRNRFQNKVVLVTGSGQGIGRGIALRFAKEGATLIVVDIKEELANAVLKDIQSTGSNGLVIKADATQAEEVKKAVKTALDKFGKIDVLVNNVGNCVVRPLLESSESDWEGSININAKSTFLWSMAVVKSMIERKLPAVSSTYPLVLGRSGIPILACTQQPNTPLLDSQRT